MFQKLNDKSLSNPLMFTVMGCEIAFCILAIIFDAISNFQYNLYTFGRLLHYFVLFYATFLMWFNLPNGKLSRFWQLILFAIVPQIEFFVTNIIGISNIWVFLFLILYFGILSVISDINIDDDSRNKGGFSGKLIKSAFKGLRK